MQWQSPLKKTDPPPPAQHLSTPAELPHSLCILLVLNAVIAYRSVPRTLQLFQTYFPSATFRIPHFTSVINWTLRLGFGLLSQVKPLNTPWLAIIDHSIDIGTKKALVVLRVPLNVLSQRAGALQRSDCECIGLQVAETVNGESIQADLTTIFNQAGCPAGVIKDSDATLNKGVRLWAAQTTGTVELIDDLSHTVANALKKEYQHTDAYTGFVTWANQVAKKLRQTVHAFLIPPKLRKKGRFMSVGRLANWGKKLSGSFNLTDEADLDTPLPDALAERDQQDAFINAFSQTTGLASSVMRVLKRQGLTIKTAQTCSALLASLAETAPLRLCLDSWLEQHPGIRQRLKVDALPISSDVIESLFGSFKHIMARNPQADMNRSVLLIPALCGSSRMNDEQVSKLLAQTPHKALQVWEQENIPYTLRKKRRAFFERTKPKTGEG